MACWRKAIGAAVLLFSAALTGCDSYYFHSGHFFEATGRYPQALSAYEKLLARSPHSPRAARVHVVVGDIYARHFQRCLEARRHYEATARLVPRLEPWTSRAQKGIMSCPDYFPLEPQRSWRYGDSQSRGRNMRLDWQVKVSSDGAKTAVISALFAGTKRIKVSETLYEKRDWSLWEQNGKHWIPILRYPFKAGQVWKARSGAGELEYRIDGDDATARTAAGTFKGCLKVREYNRKFPHSWKYDYYAPFVGRVKTTIAGPDFENPNTELIEFKSP